jgi:hypothetical protein
MNSSWLGGATTIRQLRARGGAGPRLARALAGADLHTPGLAPTAILCVRRLWARACRGPAGPPPPEWERAVRAYLGRLARRAARPARGPVPANAEAVLFADRAELLACLARDWSVGGVAAHWWWRVLFPTAQTAAVLRAWLEAPEYAPAALAHLAASGAARPFVCALDGAGARELLRRIVQVHALPHVASVLDRPRRVGLPSAARLHDQPSSVVPPAPEGPLPRLTVADAPAGGNLRLTDSPPLADEQAPAAPWQPWVPEAVGGDLGPEQEILLGVGLMLQRAPYALRGETFARALARWQEAQPAPAAPAPDGPKGRETPSGPGATLDEVPDDPTAAPTGTRRPGADPSGPSVGDGPINASIGPAGPAPEPQHVPPAPVGPSAPVAVTASPDPGPALGRPSPALTKRHLGGDASADVRASPPAMPAAEPPPASPPLARPPVPAGVVALPGPGSALDRLCPAPTETQLGGLFYLIDLSLFLELYGDFSSPARPGIALPIWDFVSLVGRRLFAGDPPPDPVWDLLCRLAGRGEGAAPGAVFEAPQQWRLPVAWLGPFPERGPWGWSVTAGRLRVRHPEGFSLIDVARDETDAARQVEAEMRDYGAVTAVTLRQEVGEVSSAGASALDRWLDWLLPYIRLRLCRALGLVDADGLAEMLLAHRARVVVTETHLDVFLSLAELPLPIRLAGLDRDPGWVPAAGRFVAFHYD